jgi:hypothetical protein
MLHLCSRFHGLVTFACPTCNPWLHPPLVTQHHRASSVTNSHWPRLGLLYRVLLLSNKARQRIPGDLELEHGAREEADRPLKRNDQAQRSAAQHVSPEEGYNQWKWRQS